MRPRRLLVITYHFPPDGAVGGLRWSGISKYLARRGWEVHVVTAAEPSLAAANEGVYVHHVPRRRTLYDRYNQWASERRASSADGPTARPAVDQADGEPATSKLSLFAWLRLNGAAALGFPDWSRGWVLRAAKTSRDLLRQVEFDAVVSSGPPHAAHLAGVMACVGTGTRRFVDMRDPWTPTVTPAQGRRPPYTPLVQRAIPMLERIALRGAAGAIANTLEFAEMLQARYSEARVRYVPNAVDTDRLPPPSPEKFAGLSIAYAGSLYVERNLTAVLHGIRQFYSRHPAARGQLALRVAGYMDGPHAQRFLSDVASTGLQDSVIVLGPVPVSEAIDLVNRSHLALVLAQNQPMQVPAKLYECVAMRVPTLVITESTSAAAREARRIGGLVCEPDGVDAIASLLETLFLTPEELRVNPVGASYEEIAARMEALLLETA